MGLLAAVFLFFRPWTKKYKSGFHPVSDFLFGPE